MPKLLIIRHAKSSWKNPNLEDSRRPLNSRGERDAPEMGRRLSEKKILPDLMISSPAVRARTTAEIIAKEIKFSLKQIKYDWELFHANTNGLYNIVHKIPERFGTVFIYGHNPGFTYFANSLGNLNIDNIPTCGIVGLEFSCPWKKISEGSGTQLFFDYPKRPKE